MKSYTRYSCLLFMLLFACPFLPYAQVTLPHLVSDSMVLQRNEPVRIWGWASPGENVSVVFKGRQYKAITGIDKKWSVTLPSMKEGGPYDMVIKASNEITIKGILVGEVWLCSGQSNMEFPLSRLREKYSDDIARSANYQVREFDVKERYSFMPQEDVEGSWKPSNPNSLTRFSAVAWFFAQSLYDKYKVPIGLIHSSWPGTPAESWISEKGLKDFPQYIAIANKFRDTAYSNGLLRKDKQVTDNWYNTVNASDKGLMEKGTWASYSNYKKEDWKPITFPGYWEKQGAGNIDGVVWVRKSIQVPASFIGKDVYLEMGMIDDIDTTYIDGVKVGSTNSKYNPRYYKIPAGLLKEGYNTIVIRIIDNEGEGGIIPGRPFRLRSDTSSINLAGQWEYRVGYVSTPLPVQSFTRVYYTPECLYYGMIEPLTPYTIKGAIWYQGESNATQQKAFEYRELLPAMIREWRDKWGEGNFPFLIVQLANYMQPPVQPGESNWAMLRESQSVIAATEPDCGLAVAIDIGEANDIHPLNKKDVGRRLALAAEKVAYHDHRIIYSGPTYQSMSIDGNKVILSFQNTGNGLMAKDGNLKQFAIAGADKKFVWANAAIQGDKVVVWSDSITTPVAVRYAWADNPQGCNLYNKEGLPASPFRTDSW